MENKLIAFTLPTPPYAAGQGGPANGYVAIPEGHPCFGMGYDAIHDKYSIEVHCGLTWSQLQDDKGLNGAPDEVKGMWIVGFDTLHYGDESYGWTVGLVQLEADNLKKQLEAIS